MVRDLEDQEIVAHLATNNDTMIEQLVEERWRKKKEREVIVVAKEVGHSSSPFCGLQRRTSIWILTIVMLMIIGGVVVGVLSSRAEVAVVVPTPSPMSVGDPLVDELILLNATSENYLWQFAYTESPQSQALAWMKTDTIVMSPGRSARDVLQRYVLLVLFYATDGPNWDRSQPYLSSDDICLWNNGADFHGVYCQFDDESIDELISSSNSLKGQLPRELGLLTNLTIVHFSINQLTGTIPTELGRLDFLEELVIDNNELTGTIPIELGQLLSLEVINYNQLTGTIPTELGRLISLEGLQIYVNRLTGTIPTELGQLLSLEVINTFYNQLTGTIPTELGQLVSFDYLDLESNLLTGTIPSELGQLLSLEILWVNSNQLTGTIPIELGQLLSLKELWVNTNKLTGTIPTELIGVGNLTKAHFSENSLTGSLEQSFCAENRTWYSWEVDCDLVECSCCECV